MDDEKLDDIIKYIEQNKEKRTSPRSGLLTKNLIINTIEFLKKAHIIFQEISYETIFQKTGLYENFIGPLAEKLILEGEIYAKIKRDGVVYLDKKEMEGIDKLLGAYKEWEGKQHNKKN